MFQFEKGSVYDDFEGRGRFELVLKYLNWAIFDDNCKILKIFTVSCLVETYAMSNSAPKQPFLVVHSYNFGFGTGFEND